MSINDLKTDSYSSFVVGLIIGDSSEVEQALEKEKAKSPEDWVRKFFISLAKFCRYPIEEFDSKSGNFGLDDHEWCKLMIDLFSHHHRLSYGINTRKRFEGIDALKGRVKNRSIRPEVKQIIRWLIGEIITYTSQLKERLVYLDPLLVEIRQNSGGEDPLAKLVRKIVKFVKQYENEVGEWLTPSLILDNYNHGNFGKGNLYDEYSIRTTKNQSVHNHCVFISEPFLDKFPLAWLPARYPDPPRKIGRKRKKYDDFVCNFFDFIGACICGTYVYPDKWKPLEKPLQKICGLLYEFGSDLFRKRFKKVNPNEAYLINAIEEFEHIAFLNNAPISSWLTGKSPKTIPLQQEATLRNYPDEYYDNLWLMRRIFWQALACEPLKKPQIIEEYLQFKHIDMIVLRDWCNSFEYRDQFDPDWATPVK